MKENNHYKKVNAALLTDNILKRIKSFKGFKRATKDNLKIFKKQRYWGTDYYISCGTKNVLEWDDRNLKISYSYNLDRFNDIYEKVI